MLQMPELWDIYHRKLLTGSETSPRERSVLQSTKLKGAGDLKSTLTSDMEMQSLEFAQMLFSLALFGPDFLTMLPFCGGPLFLLVCWPWS